MTEAEWVRLNYAVLGEATAKFRGARFFAALVLCLTRVSGAHYAFVTLRDSGHAAKGYSLAFADGNNTRQPFSYDLATTPCNAVLGGNPVSLPCDVSQAFPAAQGIYSGYCGLPLQDEGGATLGLLAVADDRTLGHVERLEALLRLLVGRTAAELECHIAHRHIQPLAQSR
ncbi:hypothetical protein SAMN02745857_03776 [Andreprevotia lacus DSM 23236]|jgi:hypothetical protein|uniref:GAF domain-containing protein n=1 Tax=Andreprevotia lacus DSM 23236 TaxID=1121001 RepID=A0A1W1XZN8_9NEIS|nr:hypothetical protein [Andreprevotia lacus]SMC29337.1 hypothetical protein SAMN02745857_03776 [Andreprevotia lacus DSM 23236]